MSDLFLDIRLVLLISAVVPSFFLGFFVYAKNNTAIGKIYLFLSVTIAAWLIVTYFSLQSSFPSFELLLIRLSIFFAVPMSMGFMLLAHTFPANNLRMSRKFYLIVTTLNIVTMIIALSPYTFTGLKKIGLETTPIIGPGIVLFSIVTTFFSASAIYFLVRNYKILNGEEKQQAKFILIGMLAMLGLIILTILIPVVFWGISFGVVFIPIYALIFLVMTALAIVKHRLFDLKVVAAQALTYALWIVLLAQIFTSPTLGFRIANIFSLLLTIVFGILLIKSVVREVLQREKLELLTKELESANVKLQEADKMKSQFLSFASHQVKSPMTVVKDYAELIKDGSYGDVPDKVKETATKIHDSAERLIALVNNLLDLRKLEEGKVEFNFAPMDLNALVKNIFEVMKTLADAKGLQMTLEAPAEPVNVKGDTEKLRQVVQNLIDNSTKYTEKGFIKVRVEHIEHKVRVSVSDSGLGIPQDLIPNLFEQFNRGSKEAKKIQGTGLGLYIAQQFMKGHGAKVWAQSDGPGKGSTFTLEMDTL